MNTSKKTHLCFYMPSDQESTLKPFSENVSHKRNSGWFVTLCIKTLLKGWSKNQYYLSWFWDKPRCCPELSIATESPQRANKGERFGVLMEFSRVGTSLSQLLNAFFEMLTLEYFCWNSSNTAENQIHFVIWIKNWKETIFKNFDQIVWYLL